MSKKQPDYGHPSEDRSNRYPIDALLRAKGFKILSRPKQGEDIWELEGKEYRFSRAKRLLSKEDLEAAEENQELYLMGRFD